MATQVSSVEFVAASLSYIDAGSRNLVGGTNAVANWSCWINFDSISGSEVRYLSQWTGSPEIFNFGITNSGGGYRFSLVANDQGGSLGFYRSTSETSSLVSAGTWHHFSINYNGKNSWEFYIDGSSIGLTQVIASSNPGIYSAARTYRIGRQSNGGSSPFDGKMAQIHMYNRNLSSDEINQIRFIPKSIKDNLVSYIRCYDSSEVDLIDKTSLTYSNTTLSTDGPPVFLLGGQ